MTDDLVAQILAELAGGEPAAPLGPPPPDAGSSAPTPGRTRHGLRRGALVVAGGAASLALGAFLGGAWQVPPKTVAPEETSAGPVIRSLAGRGTSASVLRAADVAALAPLALPDSTPSRPTAARPAVSGHPVAASAGASPRISTGVPLSGGTSPGQPGALDPEVGDPPMPGSDPSTVTAPSDAASSSTASSGTDPVTGSSTGTGSGGQSSASTGGGLTALGGTVGNLGSTLGGLVQGVTSTVGSLVGGVTSALGGLGSGATSSPTASSGSSAPTSSAPASSTAGTSSAGSSLGQVVGQATSTVGNLVSGVTSTLGGLLGGL
jgi:hypothetical protein